MNCCKQSLTHRQKDHLAEHAGKNMSQRKLKPGIKSIRGVGAMKKNVHDCNRFGDSQCDILQVIFNVQIVTVATLKIGYKEQNFQ